MKKRRRHSFSLVEVTLALGVAGISLLVIFSLLPVGLQTNQRSIEQTASADILTAVVADLRATPPTSPRGNPALSPQFGISIPAAGSPGMIALFFNSAGQSASSQQSDSRYRITIRFAASDDSGTRTATFAILQATWPAGAAINNAQGSGEMFAALDRN